jgi:hypothetical protein
VWGVGAATGLPQSVLLRAIIGLDTAGLRTRRTAAPRIAQHAGS